MFRYNGIPQLIPIQFYPNSIRPYVFTKKKTLERTPFDPNISGPKSFWTTFFLDSKFFWRQNLSGPKNFCHQKLFWTKKILEQNFSDLTFFLRGKANKKLLGSKNLFSESCLECPYYYKKVISDVWFGGPNVSFAGGAALQAVSECPRRR